MSKGIKINSVSAREFLLFLLLTTIVATLIKLSKTYATYYEVTLKIIEVPIDRTVQKISPQMIKVNAEGSGFSLLTSVLDAPEIEVPFDQLHRLSDNKNIYSFSTLDNQPAIKEVISGDLSILSATPSQILVTIDSVSSKRVPVVSDVRLSYKTGYGAKSEITMTPDSITVVGPNSLLSEVYEVRTTSKDIVDINIDVQDQVSLSLSELPEGLKLSDNEVMITQDIARFTEGKISIPITVLNDADNRVKILPKTVDIIYRVQLEKFDEITASDFLVTCDYAKASDADAYLTLTIARQPSEVKTARLINKQVKFIFIN